MIWLVGSNGLLGSEISKKLDENKTHWIGTNSETDISDYNQLLSFISKIETAACFPSDIPHEERKIKWVINCAGYTNVDKAEEDFEKADKVNHTGAMNLARICREIGAKLIHISTDYVFDGNSSVPYLEDSPRASVNVYGKTKLDGELAVQKEMNQYYIVRTSWLYSYDLSKKSFLSTMIALFNEKDSIKVVNDQKGCPTSACNLANFILKIIEKSSSNNSFFGKNSFPAYGIYHFTDADTTNWYDFAKEIYKLSKKHKILTKECKIESCSTEEFLSLNEKKIIRPKFSVLDNSKSIKEFKIKPLSWKKSLEIEIKKIK